MRSQNITKRSKHTFNWTFPCLSWPVKVAFCVVLWDNAYECNKCHFNRPGKTRRRSVKGMLALFWYIWLLDCFSSWEIRRLIPFCPCYWDTLRLGGLCMHLRVSGVNRLATRTLRGKVNNNKAESFFRLNLSVYIDLDNRERAKARDKKQRRSFSRWKKNIKILYRGWENEKC